MGIRILVADDHGVVRQGLQMFLELDPELGGRRPGGDGAEALRLARELRPDVVLMDLLMPVMDGIAATARYPARAARGRGDRADQRAGGRRGLRRACAPAPSATC